MEQAFVTMLRRHTKYLAPDEDLAPDVSLKALGLDSMQAVNLLFDIEEEFQVSLPDRYLTAETFATPASLWQVIDRLRP